MLIGLGILSLETTSQIERGW